MYLYIFGKDWRPRLFFRIIVHHHQTQTSAKQLIMIKEKEKRKTVEENGKL